MQLEGAGAVQVSTTWTTDDDLQSTNMICADSFRNSYRIGSWLAVLALITAWATFQYSSFTLGFVSFTLAYLSVPYFQHPRKVRRHRSTAHSAKGESSYGIDENGVHWEGDEGNAFSRWSAIRAYKETTHFWQFEVVDGTALLIPRTNLTPVDDAAVAAAIGSLAHKVNGGKGSPS